MSQYRQPPRRRPGFAAGFAAATVFLTRIPAALPAAADWPLAEAAWAFPLVGAGIGAVAALVFVAAQLIGLGDWPAALLAVTAGLLLTGALHEDGLADSADGLFGGSDRERRLAIMRDSRHGTFAVVALVLSIALRAAALAQIGEIVSAGLALVAAHAGSRALLPVAMWAMPAARDDGLGAAAGRPRMAVVVAAGLIALAIGFAALGPLHCVVAFGGAAAAAAVTGAVAQRRVGGYTGDILGAVQQIAEIVILLAAAALR
jgi:adenosylcobinamide-GDP ribazoletransferase